MLVLMTFVPVEGPIMHAADTLFKPERSADFIADAKRPRRRALLCDDAPAIAVRTQRAEGDCDPSLRGRKIFPLTTMGCPTQSGIEP